MQRLSGTDAVGTAGAEAIALAALRLQARIHDGPLQLLMAALQELGPADSLVADHVRRAVGELRELLEDPPKVLRGAFVEQQLRWWASTLAHEGVMCAVQVDDALDELEYLPYEAARELISNALRHAGGTHVDVVIAPAGPDVVVVEVQDDGIGIGPTWRPGYGIASLHARVTLVGGAVDYRPGPAGGTRVRVTLPRTTLPLRGA